jgi:hypothetical protein
MGEAAIGLEGEFLREARHFFVRLRHAQGLDDYRATGLSAGLAFGF